MNPDHVVHETRAAEPIHWVKTGRLDTDCVLPMRFQRSRSTEPPRARRDAHVCCQSEVA